MKILGKQPSREKCAESGWFATDYLLDAPIDRAFILSLRPLGSFVYLDMLKEPFFKIENDYYMIKKMPEENIRFLIKQALFIRRIICVI